MSPRNLTRWVVITAVLALPCLSFAQLHVMTSGGFSAAYHEVLPEFERVTGVKVISSSGASQGKGPDTIGAQLRRGVPVDVVILSREGLRELIAEGRIVAGTSVDLAETPIGVGVRAGAPQPDLGSVEAFKRAVIQAKSVAIPTSTAGIYLTDELFPRLGIEKAVVVKSTTRGAAAVAMVAAGEADFSLQPVSEILHMPGVDFAGPIPAEVQSVSVFSAAIVAGSKQVEASKRLIAFMASEKARAAIRKSGMEPAGSR